MNNKKRKIALLFVGGTHILDKNNNLLTVNKESDVDFWLEQMPELNIMADIKPVFISGEYDSIDGHVWEKISRKIIILDKKVDAFILITKIDSLIDTSLSLAFSLQHIRKTIITTASQINGSDFKNKKLAISKLRSKDVIGLKYNLINALQASEVLLPIPAIMFGLYLIPANKAIWAQSTTLDYLLSVDNEYWAKVDFGINIKNNFIINKKKEMTCPNIFSEILAIENINGIAWHFDKNILKNYKAIIIKVSPGQILSDKKKKQILDWDMPVVLYNIELDLPSSKIASITNCTWNTALIKTMWVMANLDNIENFKNNIAKDYIGEFNI